MKSLNVIFHCHNQQINLLMRSLKQNLIIIDKVLTNSLTICKCHDSESSYSIHRSQIKSKGKTEVTNNVKLFLDLCTFVHANNILSIYYLISFSRTRIFTHQLRGNEKETTLLQLTRVQKQLF